MLGPCPATSLTTAGHPLRLDSMALATSLQPDLHPWPCVKLKIGVEQNSSKCGSDGIELHAPEAYHEHGMCTLSMDNLRQDTGKAAACTTYKNMAFLNPTLLVPISHSGAQP
eukprot:1159217-Pelagomonas_calceolata.AAC.2